MNNILLCHLSDLHLKPEEFETVESRIPGVVNAISAHVADADAILLIFSGDIAHAGHAGEFSGAQKILATIYDQLSTLGKPLLSNWILVPGNHDCDFTDPIQMREMFLSNPADNLERLDDDTISVCIKPQRNFWKLFSKLHNTTLSESQKLFHTILIKNAGRTVGIHLVNTAWLSQKVEKQGKLFFPFQKISLGKITECDLSITVMHHPWIWLEAANARAFRGVVEEFSDIILTGHEHVSGSYSRIIESEPANYYIEGGVLGETGSPKESSFNLLKIRLPERSLNLLHYEWNEEKYTLVNDPVPQVFGNHSKSITVKFRPALNFLNYLDDPGAQFTHPNVSKVLLSQIFVAPDVREITETKSTKAAHNNQLDGTVAFREYLSTSKVLILGPEKSGRSALAKQLFYKQWQNGRVCLMLQFSRKQWPISAAKEGDYLQREFAEQYSSDLWEDFMQLPRAKRVVLLDDFHLSKTNRLGKQKILERANELFGQIIVFGDESLRLEDISSRSKEGSLFEGFAAYQLLEFGHVLRSRLIERWIILGREEEITEQELAAKQKSYSNVMDTLLGKSIIPANPVFLLVLLQQMEAATPHKMATGSFGYFYEYLITKSLAGTHAVEDIDLKYNYVSEVAWKIYRKEQHSLTALELYTLNESYNKEYKLIVPLDRIRRDLLDAGILTANSADDVAFKYKYNYYYFVARWLSQNLHTEESKTEIKKLASELHKEESANILIFLSYLSKDQFILDAVLEESTKLYDGIPPCDLDGHISYLNKLQAKVPEFVLIEMEARKSREDALRRVDERGGDKAKEEEAQQFEDLLKINRSYKTIEILGQMLKNYSGSMKGELKLRVARECVGLALRSMNFYMKLLGDNLQGIVEHLVDTLIKTEKIEDKAELSDRANSLLFFIAHVWVYSVIKRISFAAGSQQLEQVYQELVKEHGSIAIRLIDVAIRMDHFSSFPETQTIDLHTDLKKNFFSDSVLKRLTVSHFYMFPSEYRVRDRICAELEIKIDKAKVLVGRGKRLT